MIKEETTTLNIRIPLATKRAAQKIAKARRTTLSSLVREFVFAIAESDYTPNEETAKSLRDAKNGKDKIEDSFSSPEEAISALWS